MLQLLDYLQVLRKQESLSASEKILIHQSLLVLLETFRQGNVLSEAKYAQFMEQELHEFGNANVTTDISSYSDSVMAYLETIKSDFMKWKAGSGYKRNTTVSNTIIQDKTNTKESNEEIVSQKLPNKNSTGDVSALQTTNFCVAASSVTQQHSKTFGPQSVIASSNVAEGTVKQMPGYLPHPKPRTFNSVQMSVPMAAGAASAKKEVPFPSHFSRVPTNANFSSEPKFGGASSSISNCLSIKGNNYSNDDDENKNSCYRSKTQWKAQKYNKQRNEPYKKRIWGTHNVEEDEENEDDEKPVRNVGSFRTARDQLQIQQQKRFGSNSGNVQQENYGCQSKSLGARRDVTSRFIPPVIRSENDDRLQNDQSPEQFVDERLKHIEPRMIEIITSEIMDHGPQISWDDIAGLDFAKKTIKEIVIWPMLRPDIFNGLRGPPKGLLLFGPPGTGKTLIGKCIASQSKSTFFSISASSLTSKWVGEGEKMVKALFAVARVEQPSVIFIDEIDSLLSQRSDTEHESSRRIKTEFLVQLDGATTSEDDRILVVGATNRPQELDEAARRRFVKRLYIPLPEAAARKQIVINLLKKLDNHLSESDLELIAVKSDGYSGSDMANLCREAALGPIRAVADRIDGISVDEVRPILLCDFEEAFKQVRASVSSRDLDLALEWNKQFGSWGV